MDKLGVLTDEQLSKEASGEPCRNCPCCGSPLLPGNESNVPRCPSCGTQPFEVDEAKREKR